MSLAGDAFNLYVLLEVASLTGYALVAIGRKRRAAMSARRPDPPGLTHGDR